MPSNGIVAAGSLHTARAAQELLQQGGNAVDAAVAAALKSLDIIIREPERRKRVLANAEFMANGLQELGYDARFLGTAIVPVHCGNELLTLALYKKLLEQGVFVNPVLHPAVPKHEELLRTSYMATHDEEILGRALKIFAEVRTPTYPKKSG